MPVKVMNEKVLLQCEPVYFRGKYFWVRADTPTTVRWSEQMLFDWWLKECPNPSAIPALKTLSTI